MLARSNSSFHPRIPELQVGAVRPPSKMLRVLLLPALATALQLSTFAPISTGRAARATAGVWMQEVEASIEVSSDAEASMDMAAAVPEKNERFKAISLNALDEWAEKFPRLLPEVQDIKLASLIFPFKARSSLQRASAASAHAQRRPRCTSRAIPARIVRLCTAAHRPPHPCTFASSPCTFPSPHPPAPHQASPYLVEELIDWEMEVGLGFR